MPLRRCGFSEVRFRSAVGPDAASLDSSRAAPARPEALTAAWSRDRLLAAITAAGVPCFSGAWYNFVRQIRTRNVNENPGSLVLGDRMMDMQPVRARRGLGVAAAEAVLALPRETKRLIMATADAV